MLYKKYRMLFSENPFANELDFYRPEVIIKQNIINKIIEYINLLMISN